MRYAVGSRNTALINKLLDEGANINEQNVFGSTALHAASEYGLIEEAKILLDRKADITIRDKDNKIALHYAAISNFRSELIPRLTVKEPY